MVALPFPFNAADHPETKMSRAEPQSRAAAFLQSDCDAIRKAPFGQQDAIRNAKAFSIGTLVGGGQLDRAHAWAELQAAVRDMPSEPGNEPWRWADLEHKTRKSFEQGIANPRHAPEAKVRKAAATTGRIVATYDYTDEHGELLFQVVRFEPKDFRQRKPAGNNWSWAVKGTRQVPYRLPELLASDPTTPVYIVEGEKDVDALIALGVAATCNAGGAGKWQPEMSPHLSGRNVILVPDNDTAGRDHVRDVAGKIADHAGSIRLLALPNLSHKGDASDWLAVNGKAERLVELTAAAPAWTGDLSEPAADNGELLDFLDAHTWASLEIPPVRRFLGDLLTTASRLFIVGGTGLGKTQVAHAIAAGIASGPGFLHWRCDRSARVLVVDAEMSTALIQDRIRCALNRTGDVPRRNLVMFALDRAEEFTARFPELGKFEPLNTPEGREFMLRLIKWVKPDVVIFDNVMSLVVGDQKDEVPWSETLPLVQAITAVGIAQVWLDHTGYDRSRQYGSSTKAWRFDAVGIMTQAETENDGEVAFQLSFDSPGKARNRTPANWRDFARRSSS